ncbi:amidohydrolase family protein [Ornithinimicrobium sufpigmenti]|uniref:amidohydrolase family protein n=1 Tax=Ornithinimicrobium sufpigmenti TaxID=2508882 RepID=UPI00103611AE|nr:MULTISPECIES: amidohydrolase family protein [unclassified Ornithinimicrobium]
MSTRPSTTLILRGGRVIDPGSGFDGVADVHVQDGRVLSVVPVDGPGAAPPVDGATVVDVAGLVVGPGFVDLHSHVHSVAGMRLQAMDGVTTALDLESGLMPVAKAYADAAAQGRPLNYGFSASWASARAAAHEGITPTADIQASLRLLGRPDWQRSSSPRELQTWLQLLREELADGALGIGVLLGYAPHSDPAEFLGVGHLAAEAGTPVYTHVREIVESDPTTPVDGSDEIGIVAAETGAAMHHCHVNSTSRRHVDRVLTSLEGHRAAGSRVTVECYPYGAGSTAVGAAFLAPEVLHRWDLTPQNIVLVATGERIQDARRLAEVRAQDPGAPCVVEFLDEQDPRDQDLLLRSLSYPDAIVASDAMPIIWPDQSWESRTWPLPEGGLTHPRTAGTFARSLRRMVLETASWSWLEAFRRCSYLPARVLDEASPASRTKGHLGEGADADIVVLDPATLTDAATYLDPTRPSQGVVHLLVGGVPVITDRLLQEALPGRAVRGAPA